MRLLPACVSAALLLSCVLALQDPTQESFVGLGAPGECSQQQQQQNVSGVDTRRVIELSPWSPRAYLYKGFLTPEECNHIIAKAEIRLQRSLVAKNDDGASELSEVRTSSGMFMDKGEDDVLQGIERRISEWTFLPMQNQESLQVLKYSKGQKYEPHVDYFHDPVNNRMGGDRYATVLMYLNDVALGGETVFSEKPDPTPKDESWSECARGFLAVKPQKGDALLFFSMHPDGSPDPASMHYACPVVEGVKWSAPMWIRVGDFTRPYAGRARGAQGGSEEGDSVAGGAAEGDECKDKNDFCNQWARMGECGKNHVFMHSECKKSCNIC